MSAISQIAQRDFGARRLRALAKRGIRVIGLQSLPRDGPMPWANATRGYVVDDNGCGRVLTYQDLCIIAKPEGA